jgi:hypothetical protein
MHHPRAKRKSLAGSSRIISVTGRINKGDGGAVGNLAREEESGVREFFPEPFINTLFHWQIYIGPGSDRGTKGSAG